MAVYTTIDDPSAYFKVHLYTGTGSSNAQTFSDTDTDMQPDFVWIKDRDDTHEHQLSDSARGATKIIFSDTSDAEVTDTNALTAFGSDGFTVGSRGAMNTSSDKFVAWCWKAGGSGSANTTGSINTTKTSANTTSGFSIMQYTGNGTDEATIGHGIGIAPTFLITKKTSGTESWYVGSSGLPDWDYKLYFDTNDATSTNSPSVWGGAAPTSSVVSLGNSAPTNYSGATYIMYAFADVQGFSKVGSYTGNGNADGTFVYTGFRPAFIILKRSDGADNWWIHDNKREGYNGNNSVLYTHIDNAESDSTSIDLLSNGFKIRTTDSGYNPSGGNMIYIAFAEQPFVNSNGVPCTAR